MEGRMSETSRRGFIRGIGAGALAGYGPIILGAQNKSGSAKPILGEGDHKYEVTHDWGELPANIRSEWAPARWPATARSFWARRTSPAAPSRFWARATTSTR